MIRFACPSCKQVLQAADEQAGALLRCPHCKTAMRAPQAVPAEHLPNAPEASAASAPAGKGPDESETELLEDLARWQQAAQDQPGPRAQQGLAATLLDLGEFYRNAGRVDGAEETLRRALALWEEQVRPEPADSLLQGMVAACHNLLGIVYLTTGRLEGADAAFRQALAIREWQVQNWPEDTAAATYLGGTLCNLGHAARGEAALAWYDYSIPVFEGVLDRLPGDETAAEFLANARGGRAAAEAQLWMFANPLPIEGSSTLLRSPHSPGPPPQFSAAPPPFPAGPAGLEEFRGGRFSEALAHLDRFLALYPNQAAGWFWKARTLGKLGRYEDALAALDRSLALQTDLQPARYDRSDVLRYLGRDEAALEDIEQVLSRDARHTAAWFLKGLILGRFLGPREEGEFFDFERNDRAIAALDEAILLRPNAFEPRLFKARALVYSCNAAQGNVRALYGAATDTLGDEGARIYVRPFYLQFQCYFDRARESFDAAIRLRPGDADVCCEKGDLLVGVQEGYEEEATAAFTLAVQRQPRLARAWYELAKLASRQGQRDEALAHLRQAIALDAAFRATASGDFDWLTDLELQTL